MYTEKRIHVKKKISGLNIASSTPRRHLSILGILLIPFLAVISILAKQLDLLRNDLYEYKKNFILVEVASEIDKIDWKQMTLKDWMSRGGKEDDYKSRYGTLGVQTLELKKITSIRPQEDEEKNNPKFQNLSPKAKNGFFDHKHPHHLYVPLVPNKTERNILKNCTSSNEIKFWTYVKKKGSKCYFSEKKIRNVQKIT
jgi:hypothetical protein